MSLPSFPSLTLRADNVSQLSHTEIDNNFKFTRSYIEMLAALFGVTLNADGTLNADTVDTLQLKDRSVTEAKLGPVSVFPLKEDTGPTNSLRIAFTPPLTAYADGQIFHIITENACTGPATLQVDSIAGPVEVVKTGSVELAANDYKAGLLVLGYFDSKFHLLSSTAASDAEGTGGFSGFKVFEPADVAVPPNAAVAASGTLSSTGTNVTEGDTVTIDTTTYRFMNTVALAYDVRRGADAETTLLNLKAAINASGTAGVEYYAGTLIHPTVTAGTATATTLEVTANVAGTGGNSIATTEASTNLSWAFGTLTGGLTDTYVSYSHGLGLIPSEYSAHLININTDIGFAISDVVPIDNFTDGSGNPAFAVSVNGTTLKVEREAATIELAGLGAIDTSKWNLRVRASVKTSTATVLFPATDIQTRYCQGVFGNGNDVFIINKGKNDEVHTSRVDLSTNNVIRLTPASPGPDHLKCNCSGIVLADGTQEMVFTSSSGIYHMPLLPASPWQVEQLTNGATSYYTHKIVWHTESSGINFVYAVPSNHGTSFFINAMPMRKISMATGGMTEEGSVNFCNASIVDNAAFIAFNPDPGNIKPLLFQYNKIKKRIYIITNDTNYLHIFQLIGTSGYTDPSSILEWWQDSSRYSKLQYLKTISVAGGGMNSSEPASENYAVDFDLVTGEERAILFNSNSIATTVGSVTRVPWKE